MVNIPSIGMNGLVKCSTKVVSSMASKGLFSLILSLNSHDPGELILESINLVRLYSKSEATTFLLPLLKQSFS